MILEDVVLYLVPLLDPGKLGGRFFVYVVIKIHWFKTRFQVTGRNFVPLQCGLTEYTVT